MIYAAWLGLLLLATVTLIVMIRERTHVWIMTALIPLLLFGTAGTWFGIEDIKGRPIAAMPEPDSRVIWAVVEKPWVYIWVADSQGHRLHEIPWTKKSQEAAQEGVKKLKRGQRLQFREKSNDPETPFEFYVWDYQRTLPKDLGAEAQRYERFMRDQRNDAK